jgi:hypothetical protein
MCMSIRDGFFIHACRTQHALVSLKCSSIVVLRSIIVLGGHYINNYNLALFTCKSYEGV